ncbi:MAG: hypothetical protein ACRETA_09750 [Gammaproteobacteria bacterium]
MASIMPAEPPDGTDPWQKVSLKTSAVDQLREITRALTVENRGYRVTLSQALIALVSAYHNAIRWQPILDKIGDDNHGEES